MADGESVPLSVLAKIGSVGKSQAFRIIQWGKEVQENNSSEIRQKPKEKAISKSLSVSKDKENDKEVIDEKVIAVIEYLNLVTGKNSRQLEMTILSML